MNKGNQHSLNKFTPYIESVTKDVSLKSDWPKNVVAEELDMKEPIYDNLNDDSKLDTKNITYTNECSISSFIRQ